MGLGHNVPQTLRLEEKELGLSQQSEWLEGLILGKG